MFFVSDVVQGGAQLSHRSANNSNYSLHFQKTYNFEESASTSKFLKNSNPLFKFDFKVGNYFSKEDLAKNPTLLPTFIEITGGVRKNIWIFSSIFLEKFVEQFRDYYGVVVSGEVDSSLHRRSSFSYYSGFYSFFDTLNENSNLISLRWVSVSTLNQKFYRMFNTSSMQQRIYSN